jgi:hypothetical protein
MVSFGILNTDRLVEQFGEKFLREHIEQKVCQTFKQGLSSWWRRRRGKVDDQMQG